jgi:hypothetical protein
MPRKLVVAFGCLLCSVVCWRSFLVFEGTEFGSGSLAGNQVLASFLFVLALGLSFKFPRSAAISALIACYFSLPLYFYLVFPRPFRQVWPGQWKVHELPRETFVWDGWWVTGILATGFVACLCALSLARSLTARHSGGDRAPET